MPIFSEGVLSAKEYYADLGMDTLPLVAGTKECHVQHWDKISSHEAWLHAPSNTGIALRLGGLINLAALDIDEKSYEGTKHNIDKHLQSRGIDFSKITTVRSASWVSFHYYFILLKFPGTGKREFKKEIGTGDLRFGQDYYLVAPPSMVNGRTYELVSGSFESLISISYYDLLPLIKAPFKNNTTRIIRNKPVSRLAKKLLQGIQ